LRMTGKNHIIKTARIKDVAELDPETLGESTAPGFTFKYIDLSSVKGGRVGEHVESMTFAAAPGRARKLVKEGDILLGMVRPYLKPFAKVQRVFDGHVASTGFAVIRAKLDVTDPEYLYQTIWSDGVSKQIHQMVTGSNYPALSVGDVKDLKIPLPPLAEQRKIAEILRTWDEAIETADAELKAKQERKRGLMVKCLAPAIEVKGVNGWRTVRLGEICSPQQWTTIGQSQMTATGIPVYGANSFIGFFSESNHVGDVIAVSCRGSCGEVAFVAGPSYVTGNSMCLDDLSSEEVNIYWLYQCLKLRGFRDIISGSAQPQIIRKDVIKVKISLPPLPEQEKTAEVLLSADNDIETINNRIEALRTQKCGLMQQLLTGEIRVSA
jgi:type I restriction enzyme S subunit